LRPPRAGPRSPRTGHAVGAARGSGPARRCRRPARTQRAFREMALRSTHRCGRSAPAGPRPAQVPPRMNRPHGAAAMTVRLLVPAAATLLLAACASQPRPLQGSYSEVTPHAMMQSDGSGTPVRWGGRIVQVEPRADETCFEMISTRLTATGRPYWASDDTNGRFIACRTGFYDPAVFEVNREVTFTGS